MKVFIDTSAFLSLLDAGEKNHAAARTVWIKLIDQNVTLTCTNYILLETAALVQNRLGLEPLRQFQENVAPFLRVIWVDEALHLAGITAVMTANRRRLSLVDCVSFAAMRQAGIDAAFAFDRHFSEQGFTLLNQED